MKTKYLSGKTKLIASQGRSGVGKETNRIKVLNKRIAIKRGLQKAIAGGVISPKGVGRDGLAFMGLSLKSVDSRSKRKMLAKIIAASVRPKTR